MLSQPKAAQLSKGSVSYDPAPIISFIKNESLGPNLKSREGGCLQSPN